MCSWVSLNTTAAPKPAPKEAPDLELLEFLVTDDEPAVPLPKPSGNSPPSAPPVKKP